MQPMIATIVSLSTRNGHGLGKNVAEEATLIKGQGVAGDAHCGATVKHLSRVAKNPDQPNLRQVHLIHEELLGELNDKGFKVQAGELGENILTRGVDLLSLPTATRMAFPSGAIVEITGLRNPCHQINGHTEGLMNAMVEHANNGDLIRKAGVMAIVVEAGKLRTGDTISVSLPPPPHQALLPV